MSQPTDRAKHARKSTTNAQLQQRIEHVAGLLANGRPKPEIRRQCMADWTVSRRSVENYYSRAKVWLSRGEGAVTAEEVRAIADNYCRNVLANPGVHESVKIKAVRLWSELAGILKNPFQISIAAEARAEASATLRGIDWAKVAAVQQSIACAVPTPAEVRAAVDRGAPPSPVLEATPLPPVNVPKEDQPSAWEVAKPKAKKYIFPVVLPAKQFPIC